MRENVSWFDSSELERSADDPYRLHIRPFFKRLRYCFRACVRFSGAFELGSKTSWPNWHLIIYTTYSMKVSHATNALIVCYWSHGIVDLKLARLGAAPYVSKYIVKAMGHFRTSQTVGRHFRNKLLLELKAKAKYLGELPRKVVFRNRFTKRVVTFPPPKSWRYWLIDRLDFFTLVFMMISLFYVCPLWLMMKSANIINSVLMRQVLVDLIGVFGSILKLIVSLLRLIMIIIMLSMLVFLLILFIGI